MTKYICGESAFLIFIQWFMTILLGTIFIFFGSKLFSSSDLQTMQILVYIGLVLFISFILYHNLLKLNLIKDSGDCLMLLNFIKKKTIYKEQVTDLKISWLTSNGIIYTDSGKKYFFLLDGEDIKKVFYFKRKEVELNYKEKFQEIGVVLKNREHTGNKTIV